MQSPLLGFNNNVKHRGRLFHIQTEDSGIRHPHVITHLFADGGRILKTIKTSYAEHVGSDRVSDLVRELMKEQHKTMFIALRDGQFDHVFGDEPASSRNGESAGAPMSRAGAASGPGVAATRASSAIAQQPIAARAVGRREAPEPFGGAAPVVAVDLGVGPAAREREAAVAEESLAAHARRAEQEGRGKTPSSGRYVASRPAAIFANARPAESGGSIFGDDLISEKSLDEVILSYLSEDLETTSPKK